MRSPHAPHPGSPPTLAEEIATLSGQEAAKCYQCGKCSAGCPMAWETRLRPHDVMRRVAQGDAERALADGEVWLCLTCETCGARCPNGCDPARVMDALRELSLRRDAGRWSRNISAFHRSFLDQIRANGRMFELGLVMQYKMRSGALLQDAAATPALLKRGKLKFMPPRIRGAAEVRRIFAACEAEGRKGGRTS